MPGCQVQRQVQHCRLQLDGGHGACPEGTPRRGPPRMAAHPLDPHPLDPLSPTEYRNTAAILRRDQGVTDSWRFASIELKEPPKVDVKAWRPGNPVSRRSFSVLWNKETNQAYEAVGDLVADS